MALLATHSRFSGSMAPKKKGEEEKKPQFWFPHKTEGYVLGEVVYDNEASDDISVKLEGGATQNYHRTIAKPVNPKNLDGVGDNTQLMHLHEPSLLFNLRFRYSKDLIYTYTGYILIAVNPYKALTCYGDQEMASYRGKSIGVLPPHLYAMADRAYRSMKVRPLPPPPRNSSAQFLRALTPSAARLALRRSTAARSRSSSRASRARARPSRPRS